MSRHNTLSREIRAICLTNPKCADDDKLLVAKVWERLGWDYNKSIYENLAVLPSSDTITRARRKLVEEGLIKPSVEATERRYKAFKATRRELGYELY